MVTARDDPRCSATSRGCIRGGLTPLSLWRMQGVVGLAGAIGAGELSAREAVEASLARIEAENPRLNALTRVLVDAAPAGQGALHGVPFTVKENIDLAGTPTTFRLLGEVPDAVLDAPHVAHLRAAGAVPVGRGNLPDLALRWHTESARYGVTVNPRDPALSPGGSSGGDAAAVASGMVPFAVGSDYGGSLRVPAAACGVYALRPTPGRFPMAGSVPPSMSRQLFATDGLLARSVEDLALIAPIMARPSPRDPRYTPAPWTVPPAAAGVTAPGAHAGAVAAGGPLAVAVVAGGEIDPGSAAALKDAAAGLEAAGHHVTEIEAPRVRELAEFWRDLLAYDS